MFNLLEMGDWEDGDVMRSHLWNQLNRILQEPSPASYTVVSGTQGFRTSPTEVSVSIDGDVLARVVEHATAASPSGAEVFAAPDVKPLPAPGSVEDTEKPKPL